ncbi:MAG: Gfo/Idh/MocA family oxidoreductase [Fuerstiella sp.]|nr:Gfo/Idh/MocA family oxidoreductase [Fuerstiella sp.]MCP4859513.1 Gfo/Idh/MocA family oxidoreductase [Fuerstiella sp.]
MTRKITRRQAILDTSMAGVGVCSASGASIRADISPNEKLNIALVGAGGRGAANLAGVAGENIIAICDVDERRAAATFDKYPGVRKFHDFRRMLDDMDKQIDAVVVSTPNHIHAPASAMAMRMGKHCYCEKPLTHSVHEARTVAHIAADSKTATQMGTQIHASGNYRRVVELIQSGAIGPVREVHIRLAGGGAAGDRPRETPPVPPKLNWDVWLGPAPYRPYHPCYVPHDWHYWWDFGGGALGNMGCHYLDLAFWALDLRHPTSIEAKGPAVHPESTPRPMTIRWKFPARGESPPVTLTWEHGQKRTPFWEEHGLPDWAWGVFVGSKGMLLANYDQHALWPESRFVDFKRPDPTIADSIGHHQEWITACKTGSPTTCNFDYAGAVTETILLGNVAYRCGKKIDWDPVNLKIPNAPEAERFLRRDYRKGWKL